MKNKGKYSVTSENLRYFKIYVVSSYVISRYYCILGVKKLSDVSILTTHLPLITIIVLAKVDELFDSKTFGLLISEKMFYRLSTNKWDALILSYKKTIKYV